MSRFACAPDTADLAIWRFCERTTPLLSSVSSGRQLLPLGGGDASDAPSPGCRSFLTLRRRTPRVFIGGSRVPPPVAVGRDPRRVIGVVRSRAVRPTGGPLLRSGFRSRGPI